MTKDAHHAFELEHSSDKHSTTNFPIFYFAAGSRGKALRRSQGQDRCRDRSRGQFRLWRWRRWTFQLREDQ